MKCVYCDKEATYIFRGNSLCKTCKEKEIDTKNTVSNLLVDVGNKYIGNLGLLKAFFKMATPIVKEEVNELYKYKFVSSLIEAIAKNNISAVNVDNGIKIAMKMKKFDIGLVIHLMKQRQVTDNKTEKENRENKVTGFYKQRLEQEKNAK